MSELEITYDTAEFYHAAFWIGDPRRQHFDALVVIAATGENDVYAKALAERIAGWMRENPPPQDPWHTEGYMDPWEMPE